MSSGGELEWRDFELTMNEVMYNAGGGHQSTSTTEQSINPDLVVSNNEAESNNTIQSSLSENDKSEEKEEGEATESETEGFNEIAEEEGEDDCQLCQTDQHRSGECPDLKCFICGEQGHAMVVCPRKPGQIRISDIANISLIGKNKWCENNPDIIEPGESFEQDSAWTDNEEPRVNVVPTIQVRIENDFCDKEIHSGRNKSRSNKNAGSNDSFKDDERHKTRSSYGPDKTDRSEKNRPRSTYDRQGRESIDRRTRSGKERKSQEKQKRSRSRSKSGSKRDNSPEKKRSRQVQSGNSSKEKERPSRDKNRSLNRQTSRQHSSSRRSRDGSSAQSTSRRRSRSRSRNRSRNLRSISKDEKSKKNMLVQAPDFEKAATEFLSKPLKVLGYFPIVTSLITTSPRHLPQQQFPRQPISQTTISPCSKNSNSPPPQQFRHALKY